MASFSETLMVVAIDFGTVYSGYAFSTRSDFRKDPTNVKANQIWSAHPGLLSDKTATCLLLKPSEQFEHFGFEAEDKYVKLARRHEHQDWYFFRRFKMKLHGEEQVDEYMNIEDECGKPLPAIKVFSESIGYLMRHFLKKRDSLSIPIKDEEITWVLTVPAIWNDSAKRFMRKAAVQAGIRSTNLTIALEPEAASIYFLHDNTENYESQESTLLKRGMKYMIIDLGAFRPDKDPESRRFEIDGKYRIKLFRPFIEAGTDVHVGHSVTKQFKYSQWHFNEESVSQVFVSSNPDCMYPDDKGCQLLKQIPVGQILPKKRLNKRIIDVDFVFGDTEVEMIIREEDTDFVYNDKFEMIEY